MIKKQYTVGAYYFPNFHLDAHNEAVHGKGWTEWVPIREAKPRFLGHHQPLHPCWGYEDEADPAVMSKKIDAAADHGLDFWFFDWYYYKNGPFLNRCLEEGFLKAPNRNRMKFALMWANHDWLSLHQWDPRDARLPHAEFSGITPPERFEQICDYVIEHYFTQENYWKINGCPVFSIYELGTFGQAYTDNNAMHEAIQRFRQQVKNAGFPDLHLNVMYWGLPNLPGGRTPDNWREIIGAVGANSASGYTWVHHGMADGFPLASYTATRDRYMAAWEKARKELPVPYFPNVTMGWDNTPRCKPGIPWNKPLPHTVNPVLEGNTPQEFRRSLELVKNTLEQNPELPRVVVINAWNEWPESSILEPEEKYGMQYLEAVQAVFGAPQR